MLEPEVVVNLFPKLGVGVDLVRRDRWRGKIFLASAGRCTFRKLFGSETDEFHNRLSF